MVIRKVLPGGPPQPSGRRGTLAAAAFDPWLQIPFHCRSVRPEPIAELRQIEPLMPMAIQAAAADRHARVDQFLKRPPVAHTQLCRLVVSQFEI
ncbi:hypothetical protein CK221_25630 [Mesorhizobium sp. WSM3868]|nr:hypothetical protein CK221_25630 [Mesorhizobium sp. WSM3868]